MNKAKRVAWSKHRTRAKKLHEKAKAQKSSTTTTTARR